MELSSYSLAGHHQLVAVTTQGWNETQGELVVYERSGDEAAWAAVGGPLPVVVGKNGLAWGIGLHPMKAAMPRKQEGDGKSPAGIFSFGSAFGFASSAEMGQLKMDYLPLHEFIEAIDDPLSRYYNLIVDRRDAIPDWSSSEKMGEVPVYAIGLIVQHNFPNPQANAGSAIFFHIWETETSGTAGCTAMSRQSLNALLSWLDQNKHPVLIQMPILEYKALQNAWSLPPLKQ